MIMAFTTSRFHLGRGERGDGASGFLKVDGMEGMKSLRDTFWVIRFDGGCMTHSETSQRISSI